MYSKTLNQKMTIRFSEEVNNYILEACEIYGVTPSEYVRQVLNQSMWAYKTARNAMTTAMPKVINERVESYDFKTNIDNQL